MDDDGLFIIGRCALAIALCCCMWFLAYLFFTNFGSGLIFLSFAFYIMAAIQAYLHLLTVRPKVHTPRCAQHVNEETGDSMMIATKTIQYGYISKTTTTAYNTQNSTGTHTYTPFWPFFIQL